MGETCVREFVAAGAFVTFADVNEQRGRSIEADLNVDGRKCLFVKCDIRDWDQQKTVFEEAKRNSPSRSVDVVLANAGISRSSGDSLWNLDGESEGLSTTRGRSTLTIIRYLQTQMASQPSQTSTLSESTLMVPFILGGLPYTTSASNQFTMTGIAASSSPGAWLRTLTHQYVPLLLMTTHALTTTYHCRPTGSTQQRSMAYVVS